MSGNVQRDELDFPLNLLKWALVFSAKTVVFVVLYPLAAFGAGIVLCLVWDFFLIPGLHNTPCPLIRILHDVGFIAEYEWLIMGFIILTLAGGAGLGALLARTVKKHGIDMDVLEVVDFGADDWAERAFNSFDRRAWLSQLALLVALLVYLSISFCVLANVRGETTARLLSVTEKATPYEYRSLNRDNWVGTSRRQYVRKSMEVSHDNLSGRLSSEVLFYPKLWSALLFRDTTE